MPFFARSQSGPQLVVGFAVCLTLTCLACQDARAEEQADSATSEISTDQVVQELERNIERLEAELRAIKSLVARLTKQQKSASSTPPAAPIVVEVTRGDLSVTKTGPTTDIRNPILESTAAITTRVTGGTKVVKGQVIGEATLNGLEKSIRQAEVNLQLAEARLAKAEVESKRLTLQHQAEVAEHRGRVEVARLEMTSFVDGTYPVELRRREAKVSEAESKLGLATEMSKSGQQSTQSVKSAANELAIAKSELERYGKFEKELRLTRLKAELSVAEAGLISAAAEQDIAVAKASADTAGAKQKVEKAKQKLIQLRKREPSKPIVANVTGTVQFRAQFQSGSALARPNQEIATVTQTTDESRKNVLLLPVAVLRQRGDANYVLVKDGDVFVEQGLKLGISDGKRVEVMGGLEEGDQVLAGPVNVDAVDSKYLNYAQRIIARYDKNKDDSLTSDEWERMLMSPKDADFNGDGRVSVPEYGRWMQSRSKSR